MIQVSEYGEPIPVDQRTYDLLVVGAGMAGASAACRAASLRCSVLLVDAAPDPSAAGNTAISGGSLHVATAPLTSPVEQLRERIQNATGGRGRPDLVEALAVNSGRALAWLLWHGVQVEPPAPEGSWKTVLAPIRRQGDLHAWRGRGPQRALQRLHALLLELGGEIRPATRIRELSKSPDGAITGGISNEGIRISARSVLLADGGFQSNPALRKRFLGPYADRLFIRGSASGQGDALMMGEALGANLVNMDAFYGRCLHRDAIHNDRLWPMPFLDDLLVYGILVDSRGERFIDEFRGGITAANALAKSPDPLGASIVLDEEGWAAAYGRSGYGGSGAQSTTGQSRD